MFTVVGPDEVPLPGSTEMMRLPTRPTAGSTLVLEDVRKMPTVKAVLTGPAVRLPTVVLTASVPPMAPVAGAVTALTTRSGLTIVSAMLRMLLSSLSSTTWS